LEITIESKTEPNV